MSNTKSGGGIGLGLFLTALFIVLKLAGGIDWSWLWVLSPLWLPFAVTATVLILYAIYVLILFLIASIIDRR